MSERTKQPSRRGVMAFTAALAGSLALPSWMKRAEPVVAAAEPSLKSVLAQAPTPEMSDVFANLVRNFDALKARYDEAADRYEALDEGIRNLKFSRHEADLDRYYSYEVVRDFHTASSAFSYICLKAMLTHVRTGADCEVQEWLERVIEKVEPPYKVESFKAQWANNADMRNVVREHLRWSTAQPFTAT